MSKFNTVGNKVESSKAWRKHFSNKIKGKFEILSNYNHDIKCFRCLRSGHLASQCPNKRIIVIKEHEDIESESDKSKEDEMPPLEDCSDVIYYLYKWFEP
jgi:hypothetical protein